MPDKSGSLRWPRDIIAILSALVVLLLYFQYSTLDKFSTLSPAARWGSLHSFIAAAKENVSLDAKDAMVALLIFVVCIAIGVLELWKRRLSQLLRKVFESERRTILALFVACLICVRYYFALGTLNMAADTTLHVTYAFVAAEGFSHGEVPIWTNYFGAGSPYLQFYGFLFFYLVALVALVFHDLHFSIKLVMAGGHVLSGIGMYLFVRTLYDSRRAGFLAGLAYVMSVFHVQQVLIMGRLPLSVFYALLPFPFYFFERTVVCSCKMPWAIGGGLALALLAFTHPGYAFIATVLLILYMFTRLICDRRQQAFRAAVSYSILLLAVGIVMGSYITLPMWIERNNTSLYFGLDFSQWPTPTWGQLFAWSNYRFRMFEMGARHWYGGYLGVSVAGLAIVSLASMFLLRGRRQARVPLAAAVCLLVSSMLIIGYHWPPLNVLGILHSFNASRYLLFVVFFLSVLAGASASIRLRNSRRDRNDVFTLLFLAVMVDLGPTTFQHPYAELPALTPSKWKNQIEREAAQYPDGELPNYRTLYLPHNLQLSMARKWLTFDVGATTSVSGYNERSFASVLFGGTLAQVLVAKFKEMEEMGSLSGQWNDSRLVDGLYLLNTRYLFAIHSRKKTFNIFHMRYDSPAIVSSRIAAGALPLVIGDARAERALLKLVDAMDVKRDDNTCGQIFLADFEGGEDLGTSPSVEVLEHRTWNQRVEMAIRTSSPCFARLAYAYYPYLNVTVNDEKVMPYQTAGGFIALRLSEGEHRIVLKPVLSPLRRGLLSLSLAMAATCLAYFGWRARRSGPLRNFLRKRS